MDDKTQYLGFDSDGGIIVKNRKFRRQRIKLDIDPRNQPKKKPRKKNNKKNYLNKRKK